MANKEKLINVRVQHRHDIEANWLKSVYINGIKENGLKEHPLTPMQAEIIVFDKDENYNYERFKIGDGITNVIDLPFTDEFFVVDSTRVTHSENLLSNILETYILNIDYENLLAFDTSEIITGATSTTSVLGQAVLGQMVLA